jgi:hypothetical protein
MTCSGRPKWARLTSGALGTRSEMLQSLLAQVFWSSIREPCLTLLRAWAKTLISPALRFSATYEYLVICLVFIGLILFVCLEREYS